VVLLQIVTGLENALAAIEMVTEPAVKRRRLICMILSALVVAAVLSSAPLSAQDARPSSDEVAVSSSAATSQAATSDAPQVDPEASGALPVSLDRIREALSKPAELSGLHKLEIKPDFSVRVQERAHIQAILSTLDFKTGPRAPGGLYGYEQQRLIWNKVDRPLAQPYAGFSGGEMITLAIEGLMQKYLGSTLLNSISTAEREGAERAAREEVSRAISEYCGSRPDAGRSLQVCSVDSLSR
jgi:hypothetical protein